AAVARSLGRELLVCQKTHARHARAARRGENDLAADHWAVLSVDVHADVDVVHEITAGSDLELPSAAVSVNCADHDLAVAERFWIVLPLAAVSPDDGIRLKAQ